MQFTYTVMICCGGAEGSCCWQKEAATSEDVLETLEHLMTGVTTPAYEIVIKPKVKS